MNDNIMQKRGAYSLVYFDITLALKMNRKTIANG